MAKKAPALIFVFGPLTYFTYFQCPGHSYFQASSPMVSSSVPASACPGFGGIGFRYLGSLGFGLAIDHISLLECFRNQRPNIFHATGGVPA